MTHASTSRFSSDAVAALTLYRFELEASLSGRTLPALVQMGTVETSAFLRETWPISFSSAEFKELINDAPRFRRLGEVFFELDFATWQDGVQESAEVLESEEWRRRAWGSAPVDQADALVSAYERLRARSIMNATTDAAVDNLKGSTALKTAAKNRPCNPLNPVAGQTYDSLVTGAAPSVDTLKALRTSFDTQKSTNGVDFDDSELTHIECGPDLYDEWLALTNDDTVLIDRGDANYIEIKNPAKKYAKVEVIKNKYLTSTGNYAAWAAKNGKLPTLCVTRVPNNSGQVPGMPGPAPTLASGLKYTEIGPESDSFKLGSDALPKGWVAVSAEVRIGFKIVNPRRFKWCTTA